MQFLDTLIILLPLLAMCIRTERRLTKIETNIEWIQKKLNNGKCPNSNKSEE